MAKKKEKQQVINNIQELNLEIDYDKLAEAIVKAKKYNEDQKYNPETSTKKDFWKKVWCIITNKIPDNTAFLTTSIAGLMQLFFNSVALLLLIVGLLCLAVIFVIIIQGTNWQYLATYIMLAGLLPMIALIMRGIANEMEREKDKNYIISAFSGIVSFVALIVALIALFKGVG